LFLPPCSGKDKGNNHRFSEERMQRLLAVIALGLALIFVSGASMAQQGISNRFDDEGDTGSRVMAQGAGMPQTLLETRISELENQLRLLNGRVEQAEWQNRKLQSQLDKAQGDLEMRLQAVEQHGATSALNDTPQNTATTTVPPRRAGALPNRTDRIGEIASGAADDVLTTDQSAPVAPVTGKLGRLYVADGVVRGADQDAVKPALPETPEDFGLTPQEQYDRAFSLLRNAEYDEAENAFKGFIDKNPKDKLTENARYWLGETHFARKQYDAAAVSFAESFQKAPKGAKAPESLYKLGASLGALNKTDDACAALAEVGTRFPNGSAAVRNRASQEMKKLKCKI
jgi:tol-pal system protein YbgF